MYFGIYVLLGPCWSLWVTGRFPATSGGRWIIFMLLSLDFGGFTPSTGSLGRNKWLRIDEASRSAAATRHFATAGARCGSGSQVGKMKGFVNCSWSSVLPVRSVSCREIHVNVKIPLYSSYMSCMLVGDRREAPLALPSVTELPLATGWGWNNQRSAVHCG
jgi:hypothetical protein